MMLRSKFVLLIALMLLHAFVHAQDWAWKTALQPVPKTGFYRIPLAPDWLAKLKPDLSDVRIRDARNNAVPFVMLQPHAGRNSPVQYFSIESNNTDSTHTVLELDAATNVGTDHLLLVIANTAVDRVASLSGSNDRKRWYIIEENLLLTNGDAAGPDRFLKSIFFPFIQYRYLKLRINNNGSDPMQILQAGRYADAADVDEGQWVVNAGTTFTQKDSTDGHTYIGIKQRNVYPTERMLLSVQGPKFFKRNVFVYALDKAANKTLLTSEEIVAGAAPVLKLPATKVQHLLVVVRNGDNPPLTFINVRTEAKQRVLLAYLEQGATYTLFGGNSKAAFPEYDLAYFRDSIPASAAMLQHGAILSNSRQNAIANKMSRHDWLWPAIIVMVLALGGLTYKMTGEMKKGDTQA